MTAIATEGLGKRFGRRWALADCTLEVPRGHVVALVGPNGAGKSTLLNLAVGLLEPSAGRIEVLGAPPHRGRQLARIGFVAQNAPTYATLTVEDHLRLGARLNPSFDGVLAAARIARLGLDPARRARDLSGGQRAQLALTIGLAKRPELLLLDEPVSSLDPLARREFFQLLMEAAAADDLTIVLSSHIVADLERICDHLVLLDDARVRLAGDIDTLLATHRRLVVPRGHEDAFAAGTDVVSVDAAGRQTTAIVRTTRPIHDPAVTVSQLTLEDLVLAYMAGRSVSPAHDSRRLVAVE